MRSERAPNAFPQEPAPWTVPMVLALGAHALLFVALAWGIAWKHDATPASFEVEVWSPEAVRAAPKAEPAPEPEPEPEPPKPEPEPEPLKPAPEPPPPPPPPPPPSPPKAAPAGPTEAEIALEKAKKKKAAEEALALKKAKEKAAKEKAEREQAAKEKAAKEKAAKEKAAKEKARKEQLAKEEAAKAKAAKEKAEREQAEREKAAEEARQRAAAEQALKERFRREQMARLSNLAGKAEDTGTAQKASGPSATYAGKVVAAVRPNIIFPGTVAGNPSAEVEVTTLPTGEILGRKLVRSSGDPDWDTAVLRAIDRTQRLPRDVDGRVPSPMIIAFRPKD
jgi:colicin import membrane protein